MTACGIDPGSEKFGLALANGPAGDRLVLSAIIPADKFEVVIGCLTAGDFKPIEGWVTEKNGEGYGFRADCLFIGDGTGSLFFSRKLEAKNIIYNIIDERHTTSEGRLLYWRLNPPRGLWKIVPLSLRVPPRPVDDLAAWAILKRGIGVS
ncbi:MAG: hypothetical protein LBS45_10615 [Synergistaceae bacterium]|nr:hypothetical protein [Synergistaceae bacterium]